MLCTEAGCEKPVQARGLCNRHYKAWLRAGKPAGPPRKSAVEVPCHAAGCDAPAKVRGYCGRHYKQHVRAGLLDTGGEVRVCSVDGCQRRVSARSLCHGHYIRWSRTGDVRQDVPLQRPEREQCSVGECERGVHSRGWCRAHYARWLASGDVREEDPIRVFAGDGHVSHGYFRVAVAPDERWLVGGATVAMEHRLVMARLLGRPLRADESVHHRNGDRTCNAPDNLELWSPYQPSGQRVADKVAWAREILRRYGAEFPWNDREAPVKDEDLSVRDVPPIGFEPTLPP